MKSFLRISLIVVLVLAVIAGVFCIGYHFGKEENSKKEVVDLPKNEQDLELLGESEVREITIEEITSKLQQISQFSTYSSEYTVTRQEESSRVLLDEFVIPGTTNIITLKCTGVVKVGYDLEKITPVLDNKSHKIYISLPEIKVNDNYIIWDTIECKESNNILNPIEFDQYKNLVVEIEACGLEDAESQGIYEKGKEYVQELITNFFSCFEAYEVVFI